jgi:hypothetical protein
MKLLPVIALCTVALATAQSQPGPQPRGVTPAAPGQPPSDATLLFNGKDMTGWHAPEGGPGRCTVRNGEMICPTGAGDISTAALFGDAQIHIEFAVPHMPNQKGQLKGNSGVYLHSCYELQILDGIDNPTYANGSIGALYGFSAPMVNAARKAEEWQAYDIIFRAPRCDAGGNLTAPGSATVLLNGVLVLDQVKIDKKGPGCLAKSICQRGPLRLQDHSGFKDAPHTVMKFRNIWLRNLD